MEAVFFCPEGTRKNRPSHKGSSETLYQLLIFFLYRSFTLRRIFAHLTGMSSRSNFAP